MQPSADGRPLGEVDAVRPGSAGGRAGSEAVTDTKPGLSAGAASTQPLPSRREHAASRPQPTAPDGGDAAKGPGTAGNEDHGSSAGRSAGERSDPEASPDVDDDDEWEGDSEHSDDDEDGVPLADEDVALLATLAGVDAEEAKGEQAPPSEPDVAPTGPSPPDKNLPPQTGISVPMMRKPPAFLRTVPTQPEPIYQVPESLFDDIVRQEADRVSKPDLVKNITVFDSVEPVASATGDSEKGEGAEPALTLGSGTVHVDELPAYYTPTGPDDHTLVFESRFESGNLRRAVQVYEYEYDLILNPDYNTKSHTQWYFFCMRNTRRGPVYRFNLINMVKPTSVYNEGMRPLMYSTMDSQKDGTGWVRCGENIAYYQNGIRRRDKGGTNYYTLTFTMQCTNDHDTVFLSHCYPYTYTDLQKDLYALEKDPNIARRFRRRKLCDTLAGNACDLITITSFSSPASALKSRRAVVISARVHPGESNASWIMKGMLDYLTGASLDARILRDNFVFKIIPMLNPDGVIVGNYRCSLAGQDLNRLWGDPCRRLHPTVFFAKSMLRQLREDRDVVLYIDIHGHSRKKNVFMYGSCENSGIREKIFPALLCKSSRCFNFDDCCFKIQRSKESTARVVAYRELNVVNSFTLEASFCGADFGPLADQHFTTRHLEEMGCMVCDAILDFCDPDQTKVMQVCKELQQLFPDDGHSDDVSDSEDDPASGKRRRRLARIKKREKTKKTVRSGGQKVMFDPDSPKVDAGNENGKSRWSVSTRVGRTSSKNMEAALRNGRESAPGASRRLHSVDAPGGEGDAAQDAERRRSLAKKRKDKGSGIAPAAAPTGGAVSARAAQGSTSAGSSTAASQAPRSGDDPRRGSAASGSASGSAWSSQPVSRRSDADAGPPASPEASRARQRPAGPDSR